MPITTRATGTTPGEGAAREGVARDCRRGRADHRPQARLIGLLLLAWAPFVVRAVQVYLAANYPQMSSMLGATADTYREFLQQQGVFVFFITIWVGAGLIANDRRANALQIYLSKPLARSEYIAGKLGVLMVFLILVTWVPALLLLLLQMLFAGSFVFIRKNIFLFPAITIFAFVQVLAASFAMLALSSLSKSSRFVAILYAGIVFSPRRSTQLSGASRAAPRCRGSRSRPISSRSGAWSSGPSRPTTRRGGSRWSRSSCSSACRSWCWNGACAAWRW